MIVVGVVSGLAAGASFAAAGVLQKEGVLSAPQSDTLSTRLVWDVLHRPKWLAGIGFALVAYGLQALALSAAPLALVQPLVVSELLFAIPASARRRHLGLRWRDWCAVVALAGGLGVAMWSAAPQGSVGSTSPLGWALALGAVFALAALLTIIGRGLQPVVRAGFLSGAAAVLFAGSTACLTEFVHLLSTRGLVAGVTSWAPYTMAAFSLSAFLLIQSAFQSGPLAIVMPVSDAVEPIIAVVLGVVVLHETIRTSALGLVGLSLGATALLVGITMLDTSPSIHKLEELEESVALQATEQPAGTAASCRAQRRNLLSFHSADTRHGR